MIKFKKVSFSKELDDVRCDAQKLKSNSVRSGCPCSFRNTPKRFSPVSSEAAHAQQMSGVVAGSFDQDHIFAREMLVVPVSLTRHHLADTVINVKTMEKLRIFLFITYHPLENSKSTTD